MAGVAGARAEGSEASNKIPPGAVDQISRCLMLIELFHGFAAHFFGNKNSGQTPAWLCRARAPRVKGQPQTGTIRLELQFVVAASCEGHIA